MVQALGGGRRSATAGVRLPPSAPSKVGTSFQRAIDRVEDERLRHQERHRRVPPRSTRSCHARSVVRTFPAVRPCDRATGKEMERATVTAVRLPAGAAARSELADQRGLCCPTCLAGRKPRGLSPASAGRLWVRAPWHVPATAARGDADRAVLLSHGPRDLQLAARLSGQSVSRRSRRSRTRGRAGRGGVEYRSGGGCPPSRHRAALGGAVGTASVDADARDVAGGRDPVAGSRVRGRAPPCGPRGVGDRPRARHHAGPGRHVAVGPATAARIRASPPTGAWATRAAPTRHGG